MFEIASRPIFILGIHDKEDWERLELADGRYLVGLWYLYTTQPEPFSVRSSEACIHVNHKNVYLVGLTIAALAICSKRLPF